MQIPAQAQDILKFVEAVVRVCWYDPDDPEWVKQVPAFVFKPDKDSKDVLGLYCQYDNDRPELVAELEFKKRLLSAIWYEDEEGRIKEFAQGLQLMDGLVQLVRRSSGFADTHCAEVCDQMHHKVATVNKSRVSGVLIGPTAPIVGGTWKLRGAKIAKLTVDQSTSTLLSFKSLYKP